jgi:serine/threonine protein phosphatase PrpC
MLAGISDVGCNPDHPENQDYLALGVEGTAAALVVCDGVSSSQNSALASERAAPAACDVLLAGAKEKQADTLALMRQAVKAANAQVNSVPYNSDDPTDPAESTIVAALVQGRKVTIGWVGDSRLFFIEDTANPRAFQLTTDHSLLSSLLEQGIPLDKALQRRDAHAITRSLGGPVGGISQEPDVKVFNAPCPGWILLCSDGLWNYVPEARDIAKLLSSQSKAANAVQRVRALIEYARQRGGADNITVALLKVS